MDRATQNLPYEKSQVLALPFCQQPVNQVRHYIHRFQVRS